MCQQQGFTVRKRNDSSPISLAMFNKFELLLSYGFLSINYSSRKDLFDALKINSKVIETMAIAAEV